MIIVKHSVELVPSMLRDAKKNVEHERTMRMIKAPNRALADSHTFLGMLLQNIFPSVKFRKSNTANKF